MTRKTYFASYMRVDNNPIAQSLYKIRFRTTQRYTFTAINVCIIALRTNQEGHVGVM